MEFVLLCNSLIKQKFEMSQTPPHEMKFVKVKRKTCLLQKKIAIACGFKLYCKRYLDFQQLKT